MDDAAHFGGVFGLDGGGIVPEIEAIDVAVVEPQSGVVRMVDTLAGTGIDGKSTGHDGTSGRAQRVEHRLGEGVGPDVTGEGLAVDGDVDAARGLVRCDFDAIRGGVRGARGVRPCGDHAYKEGAGEDTCRA